MNSDRVISGSSIEHFDGLDPEKYRKDPLHSIDELERAVSGDEILEELLDAMLAACLDYTRTVADMVHEAMSSSTGVASERLQEIAADRGRIHDHTIACIRILCRTLNARGIECRLNEKFREDRGEYGRYALQVTFSRLRRFNPNPLK